MVRIVPYDALADFCARRRRTMLPTRIYPIRSASALVFPLPHFVGSSFSEHHSAYCSVQTENTGW